MLTPMQRLHQEVTRFNLEVLGLPVPSQPEKLSAARAEWAEHALKEELQEFSEAETPEDQADALLDLVYFALGRVLELGFPPGVLFDEIQLANMKKQRGELSKRPGAMGFDAIKPEGWTPPELSQYLALTREDVASLIEGKKAFTPKAMTPAEQPSDDPITPRYDLVHSRKVVVIGHARHGKDSVCEILRDEHGLKFESASMLVAEHIIKPLLAPSQLSRHVFLSSVPLKLKTPITKSLSNLWNLQYSEAKDIFNTRGEYRQLWHEAIAHYNSNRPTRLAELVFENSDIYAGVRAKRELNGIKNAGLADIIIWVDASNRLPPEDSTSISVEPWMADFVVDNNGSEAELRNNIQALVDAHF